MQRSTTRSLVLAGCMLAAVAAHAADEAADTGKSPGEMTVEQRVSMMKKANGYNVCVYEEAIEQVNEHPDIRRVADLAMGACQPHLDDLGDMIAGWGFPEHFAEGFTRNVRDRAAKKILPELAIRQSR